MRLRNCLIITALILTAALAGAQDKPAKKPAEAKKETKMSDGKVYALFKTSEGEFKALLYTDKTPITAQSFIDLVEGKKAYYDPETKTMVEKPLYNGRKIFRIIKGFMFQTGSANDTNMYNSGFRIPDEIVPELKFDKPGLLAMANTGRPNTGSTQFFVTFRPYAPLNGGYTIFGEVVEGMDTVRKIENTPVKQNGRERSAPITPPTIEKVTIVREK